MPEGRKPPTKPNAKSAPKTAPKSAAGAAVKPMVKPTGAKPVHLRAVDPVDPSPVVDDHDAPTPDAAQDDAFKRTDLIAAVSDRTALKRSDAKIVLDLVLEELGRALDRRDELALSPLGKLSVKKRKLGADGPDMLTVKIRRPRAGSKDAAGRGESPLADPGEDG